VTPAGEVIDIQSVFALVVVALDRQNEHPFSNFQHDALTHMFAL
jgi:hypothetical protein